MEPLFGELPSVFQLEIIGKCNYKCLFCPYNGQRDKNIILVDEINEWYNRGDFNETKTIGLHVLGEPTLHPDYFEIINFFVDKGIKVQDATNCSRFVDREFVDKLLDSKLDLLVLSLDANDSRTYRELKGVNNNFQEVLNGIRYYLTYNTKIKTYIQMVNHPWLTKNDATLFKEMWRCFENHLNKVVIKFLDTWAGQKFTPSKSILSKSCGVCGEIFRSVSILSDGSVVPCCRDCNAQFVYGNIRNQSLKEIWNSYAHYLLIEDQIKTKYEFLPCRNCSEWIIPMDMSVVEF